MSAGGSNSIVIWGAELEWRLNKSLFDGTAQGGDLPDASSSAGGGDEGVWSLEVCKGRLVSGLMDGKIRVWI